MKTKLAKELPLILITLAPMIFLLVKWNDIPDQLPIHWNVKGEIDDYGPKYATPLFNIGLYILLLIIPKIDPRKKNFTLFSGTYYKVRLLLALFFSTISVIIMMIGLGAEINMERFVSIGLSILFTMLGNYMGTVRPNYFFGIRTPWTLDNEEVWKKTHLLGGRIWFWGGLTCLILSLTLPMKVLMPVFAIIIGAIGLIPVVYSYLLFRRFNNSHS